ncbi:MAG: L,D-transpeptidase family protein [Woeseiaceae bacterium]
MRCPSGKHTVFALMVAISLSGCSLLQDGFSQRQSPTTDAVVDPLSQPEAAAVVTHRYTLTSTGQSVVGDVQLIVARDADTFSDIARTYGLGYDELVNANPGVDPWLPGEGTVLTLPTRFVLPDTPREGIVLNIAAKRLYWYPEPETGQAQQVVTYPIGIGRVGWATPVGEAKVIAKAKDPAWYVPASVRKEHREAGDPLPAVVGPGPDNPLGRYVLKLDMPGYLLHGTNQPYGVGMRVSHGCVRLYPEDIEALFQVAGLGTQVRILNDPVVAGWRDKQWYVSVYPRLEDDSRSSEEVLADALAMIRDRHWMLRDEDGEAWLGARAAGAEGIAYRWREGSTDAEATLVHNVTAAPAEGPTRAEVTELLDEMMKEAEEGGTP